MKLVLATINELDHEYTYESGCLMSSLSQWLMSDRNMFYTYFKKYYVWNIDLYHHKNVKKDILSQF